MQEREGETWQREGGREGRATWRRARLPGRLALAGCTALPPAPAFPGPRPFRLPEPISARPRLPLVIFAASRAPASVGADLSDARPKSVHADTSLTSPTAEMHGGIPCALRAPRLPFPWPSPCSCLVPFQTRARQSRCSRHGMAAAVRQKETTWASPTPPFASPSRRHVAAGCQRGSNPSFKLALVPRVWNHPPTPAACPQAQQRHRSPTPIPGVSPKPIRLHQGCLQHQGWGNGHATWLIGMLGRRSYNPHHHTTT